MAYLQRVMRRKFYFFVGVLLVLVPALSYAGTYPASVAYTVGGKTESTPQAACAAGLGAGVTYHHTEAINTNTGYCYAIHNAFPNDPPGAYDTYYKVLSCRNGGTLSGSTCTKTCPSGETLDEEGNCGAPCPAPGTNGGPMSGTGEIPFNVCSGGCGYERDSGVQSGIGSSAKWMMTSTFSTGLKCSPSTAGSASPDSPEYNCAKQGMASGNVNGQVVCVAPDVKEDKKKEVNTPPPGTTPDPSKPGTVPSTTETTTNTTCSGAGSCTTTTTTTITTGGTTPDGSAPSKDGKGPGSKTETSTKTEEQPKTSFCEENPNSTLCKDSSFSGTCAAGMAPACTGDAVQCAQANAAWEIKCAVKEEPTGAVYDLGKTIAGGGTDPLGNPLAADKETTINLGTMVSQAAGNRTLTESCIASPSFTVMGKSYIMDTTNFCRFASIVGYLMVAASSIIAIRMVTSGGSV